jgi:serine protease
VTGEPASRPPGRTIRRATSWLLAGTLAAATALAPAGGHRSAQADDHAATASAPSLPWYLERIHAPEAWQRTRGADEVTIALVDTGVDPDRRELWSALWSHPERFSYGYDYLRDSWSTYEGPEHDWHGTAAAAVAAAREHPQSGTVGVAPGVRLMVMRVYRSTSFRAPPRYSGSFARTAQAIDQAVAWGADVVLLPLGGPSDDPVLAATIREAGVPVVVAAGNDHLDLSSAGAAVYPASYRFPNLVTVAASAEDDRLLPPSAYTNGSNWGLRHVDLAAPGDGILTVQAGSDHPWFVDGTSFAAPQVAGALALGRTLAPDATAAELVGELSRSVRRVPALASRVTAGGILDVAAFLDGLQRPACTSAVPRGRFSDVPGDGAHAFNTDCIAWWGVAQGVDGTRFAPTRTVTRGQMASFLARTLEVAGARPSSPPSAFTDTVGHPHEASIDAVAAAGIAQGRDDGRFLPDDPVTRAQMASFVVRTLETLLEVSMPTDRPWFDDIAASVHRDNILRAREHGVTLGTGDPRSFLPGRTITREQMASFVARTLDEVGRDGSLPMHRLG